jgi:redox-sensitive bicupin YhaK (pirin superfamily)
MEDARMTDGPTGPARRKVSRVETKRVLGPDAQVDDKAMIFGPDRPALTDPFLVLSEDWFSAPGFEWHPHRGVETVTTVVDGVLEHGDNAGHAGALEPGDVQWMTAGRGIIHRELAYRNEHAHTLQLWVNLPAAAKLTGTRYQDLRAAARPVLTAAGTRIDMISGSAGDSTGPALNHWPISGALVSLEPGTSLDYAIPARDRAFGHVLDGHAEFGGRPVHTGQTAWSDPVAPAVTAGPADGPAGGSVLRLSAPDQDKVTRIMLYSGPPIGEPVAFGGPFVMNNEAEIAAAFADFRRGAFGDVPRMMRL